jgi:moderate conductance mechanosensitive channel
MIRLLFLALACLVVVAAGPAPPEPDAPALTAAQARAALEVLNNPHERAQIIATLEAIAKAQPAPAVAKPAAVAAKPAIAAPAKPAAAATPIQLAPNGLGADVLLGAEHLLANGSADLSKALHAMNSLPALWAWAAVMATNPWARGVLLSVIWRLAVCVLCALAVQFALLWTVRQPIAVLERPQAAPPDAGTAPNATASPADVIPLDGPAPELAEEPELADEPVPGVAAEPAPAVDDAEARAEAGEVEPRPVRRVSAWGFLRRVPLAIARLLLELIPILGFLVAGHLIAASAIADNDDSRLVILAVVDAYAFCAAFLCVVRMMLSPGVPRLRLYHLSDNTAAYLMGWARRIIVICVFGYAIAEVGFLLGLTEEAYRALLKANGFVLRVLLVVMVLQKRRSVRKWLRAPPDATAVTARLRNAFAYVWHWIALFFIAGSWLVWAIDVRNGFTRLLSFWIVAGLLLVGARLLLILLDGSLDRALRVPPETAARYPGLEARLRLYHPGLSVLLRVIVYFVLLLAMLQIYGVHGFAWFAESELGNRMASALGTMLVTLLLALAAWEATNAAIQRHLAKLTKDQQIARAIRLRTLLPLLRSALLITIVVFAGLTVLSEIGINIAPLLAGAGIVGVAIGFGSQKLVQDLITGVFLLLENAMQVGEWVTVSGLSGSVEALSVRTIRLRAGDGSVHIIPFSSVTTVTNVNRGLGNASVNVTVPYDEDTDRVAAVLAEIVTGMRSEPDFATKMLSDLQLWGVDKVDGAEVTIVGQVVCTDSGRWSVQREFNRRMKKRFQELKIQLYNPMRSVAVTLPPPGPAAEDQIHERPKAAE